MPENPFYEASSLVGVSDESGCVNESQDIHGGKLRFYNSQRLYHSNSEGNVSSRPYTPLRTNASLHSEFPAPTNVSLRTRASPLTNASPYTNTSPLTNTSIHGKAALHTSNASSSSGPLSSVGSASAYFDQQINWLGEPSPLELLESRAATSFNQLEDVNEEDEEDMILVPMTVRDTYGDNSTSPVYQRQRMFHSNSDGNVSFRPAPLFSSNSFSAVSAANGSASASFSQQRDYLNQQPLREHTRNRTSSPVKRLQYVDEEDELNDEEEIYDEGLDDEEMLLVRGLIAKRARSPSKQMFGPRGWLDRTTGKKSKVNSNLSSHSKSRQKLDQTASLGLDDQKSSLELARRKVENLRINEAKEAKDHDKEQKNKNSAKSWYGRVIGDVSKKVHKLLSDQEPSSRSKLPEVSKFAVTLNSLVQSNLYAQIELMLTVTANQFLLGEQKGSRLSLESVALTIKNWRRKGRPQVIEFQFDMMTQHDLVEMNLETVRFYGPRQADPVALVAMMRAWKALATEMSVRTFCAPDSVIKKHMSDAYMLLELLGAPMVTFLNFQDVQLKHLRLMAKGRKEEETTELEFGVTRPWVPPAS